MTVTINLHNFMDVIKLYGKGIGHFVPSEKMEMISIAQPILLWKNMKHC